MKLFDTVSLLEDLPQEDLSRGKTGTVVLIHDGGKAFEVEFVNSDGSTYALLALRAEQIERHEAADDEA